MAAVDISVAKRPFSSLDSAGIMTDRPLKKTERSHEENQERAYIAASRRADRSLEARIMSAQLASNIHKKRTGKGFKITPEIVMKEEMYEEEEDEIPHHYRAFAKGRAGSLDLGYRSNAYPSSNAALASLEHYAEIERRFAEEFPQLQRSRWTARSVPPPPFQQAPSSQVPQIPTTVSFQAAVMPQYQPDGTTSSGSQASSETQDPSSYPMPPAPLEGSLSPPDLGSESASLASTSSNPPLPSFDADGERPAKRRWTMAGILDDPSLPVPSFPVLTDPSLPFSSELPQEKSMTAIDPNLTDSFATFFLGGGGGGGGDMLGTEPLPGWDNFCNSFSITGQGQASLAATAGFDEVSNFAEPTATSADISPRQSPANPAEQPDGDHAAASSESWDAWLNIDDDLPPAQDSIVAKGIVVGGEAGK
ncbi:hypothetical protein VTK56DRAFT_1473 [Thermocarpiscus australiensis]